MPIDSSASTTDISFEVDNGIVSAHKALLMGHCEMMYAMFNNDFIESASDVVSLLLLGLDFNRTAKASGL